MTRFFPDISLTFSEIPDISLTTVKIPDISRFSSQVVTLRFTGKANGTWKTESHNKIDQCVTGMLNPIFSYSALFNIPSAEHKCTCELATQ